MSKIKRISEPLHGGRPDVQSSAFVKDESAATAIEYCLIAVGISIVIIAGVNAVGMTLTTTFGTVSTQLK